MRKWHLTILLGTALAVAATANATMLPVTNNGDGTDDNFNDITGGGNQNTTILGWLQGEILSYNNHVPGASLPDPTENLTKWEIGSNDPIPTIDVVAGDYVVLHYGVGTGGTPGSGGGLVALYFDADQSFTPNANGSGPNGFGGLSFIDLWDHVPSHTPGVPDGGTTAMLLGGALAGLGMIRRKFAR